MRIYDVEYNDTTIGLGPNPVFLFERGRRETAVVTKRRKHEELNLLTNCSINLKLGAQTQCQESTINCKCKNIYLRERFG